MVDLAEVQTAYYMITATGVLAAAIYYVMTLRTTQKNSTAALETRQAQLFMGFYDKFTSREANDIIFFIQEWKVDNLEDFMAMWNDKERHSLWSSIWMVYESIGVLVHEGLVDIRIVARYIAFYRYHWEKYGPFIKQARELRKRPRMYIESEYLYDKLCEFGKANPEYGII